MDSVGGVHSGVCHNVDRSDGEVVTRPVAIRLCSFRMRHYTSRIANDINICRLASGSVRCSYFGLSDVTGGSRMTDDWPEVRNGVAGRGAPFPASENAVATLYTARRSQRTGSGVTHCCHRARVACSGLCSGPALTGLESSLGSDTEYNAGGKK